MTGVMRTSRFSPRAGALAPFGVLSAIPDFAMAALFAVAWTRPALLEPHVLRILHVSMLLEFVVVHSGAFMGATAVGDGSRRSKVAMMAGLGVFYSLFALAFSLAFRSWWPLASFWGLMLNRMLVVILDPRMGPARQRLVMANWGLGVAAYLFAVFFTTLAPIPRLAFSSGVIASLQLPGSGLWISEPWRVMALGAIYYATIGVAEVFVLGRMPSDAPAR
jgi:hypothetical protein